MSIETWGEKGEYHTIYDRLNNYPPKELLDKSIRDSIQTFSDREGLDTVQVAELGAGPAPISCLLTDLNPEKFVCTAMDKNPSMRKLDEYPFEYDTSFDLTNPSIPQEYIGKFDVVVLENALYTTTMSPDGRKYTPKEAEIMRTSALKKAASMIRPEGILVLSDPLTTTQNFSPKRILQFLNYEQQAIKELKGEQKSILNIFLEKLSDKDMQRILKINKKIMENTVLLDENGIKEAVMSTGLFFSEPLEYNPNSYLGSNITAIYRRNGQEVVQDGFAQLGNPIILEGEIHKTVLHWIGEFRKRRYEETKATTNLPEVDKFDLKKEGIVVLYNSKNKLTPAATATFQEAGKIGLDVEHIMLPNNGNFYKQLIHEISTKSERVRKELESGGYLKFGEIRRLATDSLGQHDFRELFSSMCDIFFKYAKENDIDIVMFVSDRKRAKAFNMANGKVKFEEIEGFKLNRNDTALQTMMIPAYNYFFSDWESVLSEKEKELINELSLMIRNGDLWTEIIKDNPKEEEYRNAVNSLLTKTSDNVGIYFTDYSMSN